MSTRTKQAAKDHLGVFALHPLGAQAAAKKEGRRTPKGPSYKYKTIMVLGKPTQVPVGHLKQKAV